MRRNQPFEVRGIDAVIFRLEQEYFNATRDKDPFVRDWKLFKTIRIEQKIMGQERLLTDLYQTRKRPN